MDFGRNGGGERRRGESGAARPHQSPERSHPIIVGSVPERDLNTEDAGSRRQDAAAPEPGQAAPRLRDGSCPCNQRRGAGRCCSGAEPGLGATPRGCRPRPLLPRRWQARRRPPSRDGNLAAAAEPVWERGVFLTLVPTKIEACWEWGNRRQRGGGRWPGAAEPRRRLWLTQPGAGGCRGTPRPRGQQPVAVLGPSWPPLCPGPGAGGGTPGMRQPGSAGGGLRPRCTPTRQGHRFRGHRVPAPCVCSAWCHHIPAFGVTAS